VTQAGRTPVLHRIGQAPRRDFGPRQPLTTTHHHGQLLRRSDGRLGLVRISKNASSELVDRLACSVLCPFHAHHGPVVAFFRNPVRRFLSSIPETLLRVTYAEIADPWNADRVICPEDVYHELCAIAGRDIPALLEGFVDLVEYAFFDAHHEPQLSFLTDRRGRLRIDPHVYAVETLERDLAAISARFGIAVAATTAPRNVGGQKPEKGRTFLRDLLRRATGTGGYHRLAHAGPLGVRYGMADRHGVLLRPMTRFELNGLANRFAQELRKHEPGPGLVRRIRRLYASDETVWEQLRASGGDHPLSDLLAA